jgi:hypothetical protein
MRERLAFVLVREITQFIEQRGKISFIPTPVPNRTGADGAPHLNGTGGANDAMVVKEPQARFIPGQLNEFQDTPHLTFEVRSGVLKPNVENAAFWHKPGPVHHEFMIDPEGASEIAQIV